MSQKKTLVCDVCGKPGAKVRRLTRSYGNGANLLVIEDVPVVSCPHCGESYLTADTLHELDRLKAHRRSLASSRRVPVVAFAS
jgi:YgiT-type zinc finger domain-containing protein